MTISNKSEVTQLLLKLKDGNEEVLTELAPLLYQELRKIASSYLKRESGVQTIQTTDLVNEAYLRLVDEAYFSWENRIQFFAIAARAMRQYLIYYAKHRKADKRGGGQVNITLNEDVMQPDQKLVEILAINEAMERLETYDPRLNQIVELRYFAGLTIDETSKVMNISPATVKREWTTAKAWLATELSN